ncbi:MAG: tetratricopeptide repeat protein, partial [bacterium]|nr:tetratricopeptide repeat protein [bacterium]MDW8163568.1 tetratricopeptide repeat protein [Candidatus Omnitrophota bacterium]
MKKQIFFYLLLSLFEIGETNTNFIKLAITSFEKGYYELSNKYLEDYIASEKEEYIDYVYLLYGYNLYNLGKYEEAIEKFQTLISKFPLSQYLKNAYLSLLSCYWKVEDINSLYTYYLEYRNNFEDDTEEVERKIGEKILQKGINFFKNKDYQEGKKYFSLILDSFKDNDLILWANY